MQRAGFPQRHTDHCLLCFLGRLADRLRHLTGLAVAETDAALLIANHHQGGKREATATLYGSGDAIDVNQLFDDFAIDAFLRLVPVTPIATFSAAPLLFATSHAYAFLRNSGRLHGPRPRAP